MNQEIYDEIQNEPDEEEIKPRAKLSPKLKSQLEREQRAKTYLQSQITHFEQFMRWPESAEEIFELEGRLFRVAQGCANKVDQAYVIGVLQECERRDKIGKPYHVRQVIAWFLRVLRTKRWH